jgi:hypothetical protein
MTQPYVLAIACFSHFIISYRLQKNHYAPSHLCCAYIFSSTYGYACHISCCICSTCVLCCLCLSLYTSRYPLLHVFSSFGATLLLLVAIGHMLQLQLRAREIGLLTNRDTLQQKKKGKRNHCGMSTHRCISTGTATSLQKQFCIQYVLQIVGASSVCKSVRYPSQCGHHRCWCCR